MLKNIIGGKLACLHNHFHKHDLNEEKKLKRVKE